jgi:uncharacterized phage protein (TIGR02220 family)
MRESFVFYKSFFESIKELDPKDQVQIYNAIFEYEFYKTEPQLSGVCKSIFTLILPQLEANDKRYENGKKGGRPKKEETKTKPKNNQNKTKVEPNVNDNVNVNDINININNNINNNLSCKIEEVINYLNQPSNTTKPIRSFKSNTKNTKSIISARLKEGFTVDDLKDVIYFKYEEWVRKPFKFSNGVMSDKYYRPETLFNSKNFENYLQEYKDQAK